LFSIALDGRSATRTRAAHLMQEACLAGVPFCVDERANVPRGFFAEPGADGRIDRSVERSRPPRAAPVHRHAGGRLHARARAGARITPRTGIRDESAGGWQYSFVHPLGLRRVEVASPSSKDSP